MDLETRTLQSLNPGPGALIRYATQWTLAGEIRDPVGKIAKQ
jgi:hypothetical protein